jgi:flagellar basal body rod protein FlgG
MDVAAHFRLIPRQWLQFNVRHLLLATFLAALASWWLFHRPRGVQQTGRDLDVAIFGRGYFICTDPVTSSTWYTRCGRLSIDANGALCVGEGRVLEPNISIPPEFTSVWIATDGNVYYYVQSHSAASNAGQLQLATFNNSDGLKEVKSTFRRSAAPGCSKQVIWKAPRVVVSRRQRSC